MCAKWVGGLYVGGPENAARMCVKWAGELENAARMCAKWVGRPENAARMCAKRATLLEA